MTTEGDWWYHAKIKTRQENNYTQSIVMSANRTPVSLDVKKKLQCLREEREKITAWIYLLQHQQHILIAFDSC